MKSFKNEIQAIKEDSLDKYGTYARGTSCISIVYKSVYGGDKIHAVNLWRVYDYFNPSRWTTHEQILSMMIDETR